MSTVAKNKEDKKVSLRDLDDVACSNVVVTRQIRRLVAKFHSMKETAIDCWVHGGHYTKFELTNSNKLRWHCDKNVPCAKKVIYATDDELTKEELNKLLVSTHRDMCDNKEGVDLIDTPEDLLAFAETKLQEMLKDSAAQ